ncbi:MAG: DUF4214 domain-containing protein, partial [Sulfuricurvum sp.]|nr:DUF4214 domain-containing protein [Sulfuricurvum sp.]
MASAALQTQVAELYTAFFNRAPDAAGFQFWLSALDSGRLTLDQMKSDWWSTQAETALKYPATLSVSDFVEQIYINVLGRASDASGKAFWSEAVTNGSLSRENCIQNIIDATKVPSATGPDTQYLANKAAVGVHFAQSGNNDGLQAVNIVKIVTSDSASVNTAIGMIDGTTPLNGTVMDGYINGATVFLDSNFNGKLDTGEASTTTNTTGGYSLAGGIGQLVSTGGIDMTTNAANKAVFTSSMGSTIISPVSTLVAQKMADGASIEVAQTAIKAALGITSNINLSTVNPLSVIGSATATDAEKSVALKLQAANVQVNNILSNAVSALTGAGETMDATKLAAVMSSAAGTIAAQFTTAAAAGTVVNLSSASFINTVLTGVASTASSSTIMASMNTNAQSVANVLADNNTKIDTQVSGATASTLTAALGQIGKIQEVVQDSLSAALAAGTTNMATITSTYTGAAADTLFSNATIGSFDASIVIPVVTPPASTPAPTPDTTAPTVILTYSVDGGATYTTTLSAKDADTLKIKATFSEAIADGTGATIAINNSILSATAMTKVSTTIYTYDLNVPVGNIAIATVSIGAAADASGNVISTTPANAVFAVDNTAPASLAAITLDLDTASDTGTSTSDDITSDATPAIRVSTLNGVLMTAGDIIRIVDTSNANAVVGSYTVLSGDVTAGAWNGTTKDITVSTLSTGAHALKVQLVDAAGNTGTISTAATTVTIDTTASTTTVGSIDISADTGSATDFTTLTAAQTITGTLSTALVAGEVLNGSVDGGSTWTNITAKAAGTAITWDGATLSGSSSIKIKVTDAAGNDGTVATQAYVLDTTAPTAPTGVAVTSVGGTVVANTINATNTHLTAQATITAGQATGGSAVLQVGGTTVATDASILVGDTTVTFTTSDSTPTTAELQAAISAGGVVTVTVTDLAGNTATSSVSNPTLVRDIVAPAAHASPISGSDMGGATGYGEGDLITLSFSEAVAVSTVIAGNLAINNAHSLGTSPT